MQLLLSVLGTLAALLAVAIQTDDWLRKRRAERTLRNQGSSAPTTPPLPASLPVSYSSPDPHPAWQQAAEAPAVRPPLAPSGTPLLLTRSGLPLMDDQAARAAVRDASPLRRWVGPWLWAACEVLVVVNAAMVVVDLQNWVDRLVPHHTQQQTRNVAMNAVVYCVFAALVSIHVSRGHVKSRNPVPVSSQPGSLVTYLEGPRMLSISLRGKIYAAYAPLDVAMAAAVVGAHPTTVLAGFLNWWSLVGALLVLVVVFLETDIAGWLRSRRQR